MLACGLAARDSLRLEAGMPLYRQELTRHVPPCDAGLGRVVDFGTEENPRGTFVGRGALARMRDEGMAKKLVGLVGDGRRSPRTGYSVSDWDGNQVGVVTSGAPSPTLGHPIALAYVPDTLAAPGTEVGIDVRGRREHMRVVALPFYKRRDRKSVV